MTSEALQQRIHGREEVEALLELCADKPISFREGMASAMLTYAEAMLGATKSSVEAMSDEQAQEFEHTFITFGQHTSMLFRDIPIAYLTWLADQSVPLMCYLRSKRGLKRIEKGE